jgi:hypothetical protein
MVVRFDVGFDGEKGRQEHCAWEGVALLPPAPCQVNHREDLVIETKNDVVAADATSDDGSPSPSQSVTRSEFALELRHQTIGLVCCHRVPVFEGHEQLSGHPTTGPPMVNASGRPREALPKNATTGAHRSMVRGRTI